MQTIWSIFEEICSIPHCSYKADGLKNYIVSFATKHGYIVEMDAAQNIMCRHEDATLTLQAHYDMVCIGNAPRIEPINDGVTIKAKESSLGADNGIALALMLKLMTKNHHVDCLFTANEEVGLIGARELDLEIKTSNVLNLDSEEEGAVFIGCAGGVDMVAMKKIAYIPTKEQLYRVTLQGLQGGHSGVDIDKGIPSANEKLAHALHDLDLQLHSFNGGERRNSIAKHAHAVVTLTQAQKELLEHGGFEVERSDETTVIDNSREILTFLANCKHGILEYDTEEEMVISSINLAIVTTENAMLKIESTLRSMKNSKLEAILEAKKTFYKVNGCRVKVDGYYAPWEAKKSTFAKRVALHVEKFHNTSSFEVMHAGLECGVLQQHAKDTSFVSIGPNIYFPHSNLEYVEIASVERFEKTVVSIIEA